MVLTSSIHNYSQPISQKNIAWKQQNYQISVAFNQMLRIHPLSPPLFSVYGFLEGSWYIRWSTIFELQASKKITIGSLSSPVKGKLVTPKFKMLVNVYGADNKNFTSYAAVLTIEVSGNMAVMKCGEIYSAGASVDTASIVRAIPSSVQSGTTNCFFPPPISQYPKTTTYNYYSHILRQPYFQMAVSLPLFFS